MAYSVVKENILIYILILRTPFYSVASGLKIIGHGNADNNSESHYSILEFSYLYKNITYTHRIDTVH
jgi:hypothetical protein